MELNESRLNELLMKMIGDMGAAASGALIIVGEKLGLYKALAEHGPVDSSALAKHTGTAERYLREWLAAQAASGYISYDPSTEGYSMTPEQVAAFADDSSPVYLAAAYYGIASLYMDEPTISDAFRSGRGVGWHEHSPCLFCGTEKFFGATYTGHLIQEWIPALDGVQDKLRKGGTIADVGCGHGVSTLLLAKAFPKSKVYGFDYHDGSIGRARELAKEQNLTNVEFHVAEAKVFPGSGYDLVAFFDCLHDMGDPVGAARRVREVIAEDGTWMVVEPLAGDRVEENLHPVGRVFYSYSTMVCTPASLSQEVGLGLGAQAGEGRLRTVIKEGGFTRVRRATETPFNMILEARP